MTPYNDNTRLFLDKITTTNIDYFFIPSDVLQQQLMHILNEITTINDKQLPLLYK